MSQHHKPTSLWRDAFSKLYRNRIAFSGLIFLILMTFACLIGPMLSPYSYQEQNLNMGSQPPSLAHWFGTDPLGRDLLTRMFYGGRISLMVGLAATFVSLTIGILYGGISGYMGNKVDKAMMRIADIIYSLPFTLFVILLMVVFGRNFLLLFAAIGSVEWMTMARIVRGQVLSLKEQTFVQASRALGQSNRGILRKHLLPNTLGTIIVWTTLTIPHVILLESFISFLGLGVQPPMSSWGVLIKDGSVVMEEQPWLLIFPCLFFTLTLFSLNFLGDGLRDALDPRTQRRA